MSDGRGDPAHDATLASTPGDRPADRSGEALGDTIAADAPGATPASAAELPDAAPDRYALGEEIGRGGLGAVVRAKDRNLGRQVAIKALHASGGSARRRFVREALITARLEHPSIVPVHDAGRWPDGSPFYAMKLVRGRPLAAVIDETATFAARLALVPTVLAVCDAVAYAHSERVVHRDLKPHNVLVGEFGETVVIDWGLAKELGAADVPFDGATTTPSRSTETIAGSVLGTPAYMAPEQATGGDVDERADVYALGAMLYHVLVGKPPRDGGSVDEVLDRAVTGAVVPLVAREPGVPRDLAAIVGKAMARAPSDRYPSARELADDLRRFTTGQLVGAHRYTWSQRARRWLARHRAIAVTVAAAVAVTATIATISVRDVLRERDRADGERDVAVAAGQRADQQRAAADAARAAAQAAANRAVLAQARGALERDPALALAWLATLSVDGPGWDAAHVIAADALWRGPPDRVLRGHRGTPRGLSVGGTTQALSWDDGAVWLWDLVAGTGRSFAIRRTHAAALCSDGRILGLGIRPDGTMSEYAIDVASGAIAWGAVPIGQRARCGLAPPPALDDCDLADATPDGATIACGAPSVTVRKAGGAARMLRKQPARAIEIDDDGRLIAADDDGGLVDVYDVATGALRWKVPAHGVTQLAFSPDGDQLLVVADDSLIWDTARGGARPFGGAELVAATWLSDGRIATIGADRTFRLWTPRPLPPRQGDVTAAGFTPGGGALVLGLADGTLARVDGDRVTARAKLPAAVRALEVRADGAVVATVAGGDVWSWRAGASAARVGAHREASLSNGPNDVAWLGDDVVSWNGETVRVWPGGGASYREIALPPLPPPPPLTDTPGELTVMPTCAAPASATSSLVVPPRGRTLAIARETMSQCEELSYLVDVDAGAASLLDGADGRRAAFTPDGAALVTSAPDGELRVWDVASRRARTIDAHLVHPQGAAVSADGAWLAATGEGAVALARIGDAAARVLEVDEPELAGAWLDRAGATLVAGAASGAWIWDLASGERRHLGIGAPLAIHVGDDELDAVADGRVWRIRDDLPRAPADLARRLAALGYTLP